MKTTTLIPVFGTNRKNAEHPAKLLRSKIMKPTITTRTFANGKLIELADPGTSRNLVEIEVQPKYKPGDPHRVRISWMVAGCGTAVEAEQMAAALIEAARIAREEDVG